MTSRVFFSRIYARYASVFIITLYTSTYSYIHVPMCMHILFFFFTRWFLFRSFGRTYRFKTGAHRAAVQEKRSLRGQQ